MKKNVEIKRASGVLAHPTSFPGKYGIGSLGLEAYSFVDFLKSAGQSFWQIMPLGPTGYGDSPYACFSAFAGNTNLICLDEIKNYKLLSEKEFSNMPVFPDAVIEFGAVIDFHNKMLAKAFNKFKKIKAEKLRAEFSEFKKKQKGWLNDYAKFMAYKDKHKGKIWSEWSNGKNKLKFTPGDKDSSRIEFHKFLQFLFFKQWFKLKNYANKTGIKIIGDMPIFVAYDSADVWANPKKFLLDKDGNMTHVAGVPPDFFSKTGQLWGNPLYNWKACEKAGFEWWIKRFEWLMKTVDIVRIDHFRGFCACWSVPAHRKTAENGEWKKAPGNNLFKSLKSYFGELPFLAEDLGEITPDVIALRKKFGFPGMKILQFAFGGKADNPFLPHNYDTNCVVYTGSHDNNTTKGWYDNADKNTRNFVRNYYRCNGSDIAWDLIRGALASVAELAIIPMQDILSLGEDARMNFPGKAEGNWQWRFKKNDLNYSLAAKLKGLTELYGRTKSANK